MAVVVQLTPGNVANGHVYVTKLFEAGWLDRSVLGPPSRSDRTSTPVRLDVNGFDAPVYTDVPTESDGVRPRRYFRDRSWVPRFLAMHGLSVGDAVAFDQVAPFHFRVSPVKRTAAKPPSSGSGLDQARRPSPPPVAPDQVATLPVSTAGAPMALPFPDSEAFIEQVLAARGLPERNAENLVRDLFVRLGHRPQDIVFQAGRIDVAIRANGRIAIVVEVKRALATEKERRGALRQGFDYANESGAAMVVITDGDRYELFDRTRGLSREQQFLGGFSLTAFTAIDLPALNLLRPEALGSRE